MGSATADGASGLVIVRRIAIGGMAEVFLARGASGEEVVLKVLLPHLAKDPEMVAAFGHEAAIGRRLAHPRIAEVRGSGTHEGAPCLVLSRVDGVTLAEILATEGERSEPRRVPLAAALAFGLDVLEALAHAHGATDEGGAPLHLVHRDVSPRNVFVNREGRAVLGDFGIARSALREGRTRTGAVKGTLGYLAPEQVTGSDVDARADLFAVGALIFELATGASFAPPGGDLERLRAAEAPVFRAPSSEGADARLDKILRRALARFPEERYGSAEAFRRELAALVTEAEIDQGREHLAELVLLAAGPASVRGEVSPSEREAERAPPSPPSAPSEVASGSSPGRSPWWPRGAVAIGGAVALGLLVRAMGGVGPSPSTFEPEGTSGSDAGETASPTSVASPGGVLAIPSAVTAAAPDASHAPLQAAPSASVAGPVDGAPPIPAPTSPPRASSPVPAAPAAPSAAPSASTAAEAAAPTSPAAPAASTPPPSREQAVRAKLDGVSARVREAKRRGADTSLAEARSAVALEAFLDRRYDAAEREIDAIAASLPP